MHEVFKRRLKSTNIDLQQLLIQAQREILCRDLLSIEKNFLLERKKANMIL